MVNEARVRHLAELLFCALLLGGALFLALLFLRNALLHILAAAATRRAGMIDAILAAEILLAVGPEGKVKGDLGCIHHRSGGEALLQGQFCQLLFCHNATPLS